MAGDWGGGACRDPDPWYARYRGAARARCRIDTRVGCTWQRHLRSLLRGYLDQSAGRGELQILVKDKRFVVIDEKMTHPLQFRKVMITPHLAQQRGYDVLVGFVKRRIVQAHGGRQAPENFLVGQCQPDRSAGLALRPHAEVEVGEGQVIKLQKAGRGQNDVGIAGRIGGKAIQVVRSSIG